MNAAPDFGDPRSPPSSVPAEQALLGAILTGRAAIVEVAALVGVADFFQHAHRVTFRTIGQMADRGEPIDLVTVAEALESAGDLDDAGGPPYLGTLVDAAGACANVGSYARIVRETAVKRRLTALGDRLTEGPNGSDVADLLATARDELDKLTEEANGTGTARNPPGLAEWLREDLPAAAADLHRRIFELTPPPPPVLIEGLFPCDTFGLVGPAGVSKSTFALWVMIRVILGWDVFNRRVYRPGPCLYISAEDPRSIIEYRIRQLCDRMNLSPGAREVVARDLHIEDWTGLLRRFVEADATGNPFGYFGDAMTRGSSAGSRWQKICGRWLRFARRPPMPGPCVSCGNTCETTRRPRRADGGP